MSASNSDGSRYVIAPALILLSGVFVLLDTLPALYRGGIGLRISAGEFQVSKPFAMTLT